MVRVTTSFLAIAILTALAAAPVQAGTVDEVVSEFPEANAALIAATEAYFDRVEGAEAPSVRKVPAIIGTPLLATKASASVPDETGALNRNGPVRHLTGYNVTWYPLDRLLGSVDYMGTWDGNRNLVCGYLSWDLTDPDSPELVALEASYVDMDELSGKSALQIHRALLSANCAFGAIDENFAFFDVAG